MIKSISDKNTMPKYTIQEQQILEKLNISDFRKVNKENLLNLYSEIKHMTPEVAEKVLEQVKHFSNVALDTVREYKDIALQSLESAKGSQKEVYKAKLKEIEILENELNSNKQLKFNEKTEILDRIDKVAEDMHIIHQEHQNFVLKFAAGVGTVFIAVLGTIVAMATGQNPNDHL